MKRLFAIILTAVIMLSLCSCSLFSSEVSSLELSETDITMSVGDSKSINVKPEPKNAKMGPLTWYSTDTNIVKVEDGVITAVAAGSTVVKVETEDGVSASCNITVKEKVITSVSFKQSSVSMMEGSRIQLEVTVLPVDAPLGSLKWSSSNDEIATVNSSGYVTGIKKGTVNIVCKASDDIETSCTVTVQAKEGSSNTDSDSGDNKTVVNNYYGYGHFHPNYVYSSSDFVFPESSSRLLTDSEIYTTLAYMSGYSPSGSYAQDGINEIYARNGYVFKTAEIRAYYESKPWYYADSTFTINDLSSIEKSNIALLEDYV